MKRRMPSSSSLRPEEIQTSPRRATNIIRASIRRGMIREKNQLSEERLVESLAMSRNSVRAALRVLADDGILTRRRNFGTSVKTPIMEISLGEMLPSDAFTADGRSGVKTQLLDQRIVAAPRYIADRIGYLRVTDPPTNYLDTPASITTTFPVLFGKELGEFECAIEVSRADAATSRLIGVEEGDPILLQEVLLRDESGVPQALSYTSFRADLVTLSVSFSNPRQWPPS
jgi:GntR family transcriptional regulator